MTYFEKQMKYVRERNLALAEGRNPPDPPENRLTKIYKNSFEYYRRLREGRES
jgi:hypothetical protein